MGCVGCSGDEDGLLECPFHGIGYHKCFPSDDDEFPPHGYAASISCTGDGKLYLDN